MPVRKRLMAAGLLLLAGSHAQSTASSTFSPQLASSTFSPQLLVHSIRLLTSAYLEPGGLDKNPFAQGDQAGNFEPGYVGNAFAQLGLQCWGSDDTRNPPASIYRGLGSMYLPVVSPSV